jgi:hypothetical protein
VFPEGACDDLFELKILHRTMGEEGEDEKGNDGEGNDGEGNDG